jgi:hypothetical protein
MNNVICEHDLLHKVERHECDGCCARYVLTDEPKSPFDDGVASENKRVVDILKKERSEWGMGTMAARILENLLIQIERKNK